ncbi:hypothetical protein AWC38_SpisGene2607 [Stylophora pistillata]|uniref:Uncharacterized protein n=1 Tax=Stylophora pistillata TaxID=50429 RepID=A0A2B4SVI2_STYPI|nr:hypothetical protein AWC38_SpisGene2607 [Stylophora pistillata]
MKNFISKRRGDATDSSPEHYREKGPAFLRESLKTVKKCAATYFTHEESYYPVPQTCTEFADVNFMLPLPSEELNSETESVMKEFLGKYRPLRQRTVWEETTKNKAGVLPPAVYTTQEDSTEVNLGSGNDSNFGDQPVGLSSDKGQTEFGVQKRCNLLKNPSNKDTWKVTRKAVKLLNKSSCFKPAVQIPQQMTIKSGGKIVYDTDNLHKVMNLKNLLEYSDDYSRSVAKNSLWYLDTDHRIANANQNNGFEARRLLTTGNNNVNVKIPLNRYSFFEELEDRVLPPMQLQFTLTLLSDANLVWKAAAVDDGRVVINRLLSWVPYH